MSTLNDYRRAAVEEEQQAFVELLRQHVVTFHYRKKSRQLVKRRGTLRLDLIPEQARPKGTGRDRSSSPYVSYYDFTAGGWRSMDPRRVTSWYPDSITETIMESEVDV